jgi:hypothetical protein
MRKLQGAGLSAAGLLLLTACGGGGTTGRGVGDKWFATTPLGKKARSASGGSPSGYGY